MKYIVLFASISFVLLFSTSIACADSAAPEYDYIVEVGDGRYVFVMLSIPNDMSSYGQGGSEQNEEIRAKYCHSGLYWSENASDPIWTIDWYSFRVDITSDGKHLARRGPWAFFSDYDEIALEFYEDGELLVSYHVNDLIAEPEKLPHSVSHYNWESEIVFFEDEKELFLRTQNGEEYLFDVSIGSVIESKTAPLIQEITETKSPSIISATNTSTLIEQNNAELSVTNTYPPIDQIDVDNAGASDNKMQKYLMLGFVILVGVIGLFFRNRKTQ